MSTAGKMLGTVACVLSMSACHQYDTVNDLKAVVGTRGRLTLSPEGRGNNAKRLGGVATEITGVLVEAPGDSIGIKADEVRFSDLGVVPFAQGELHFAPRDVAFVAKETINRGKTTVVSILGLLGVVAIGIVASPGNGIFGIGKSVPPTPK